jgi:anaerobic ribonucleoside-triphosphate reductase activating protein
MSSSIEPDFTWLLPIHDVSHPKRSSSDALTFNLAAYASQTRVLGPGVRAGVWVQGCAFHCPGCIAPEWIQQVENRRVAVEALAQQILSTPVSGLTFSGGEPFLQAEALAELARQVRLEREVDLIIFSGFTLAALQRRPSAAALLEQCDLLVDGGYVAARDRGIGLRGSDNQRFHFLSSRLINCGYDFERVERGLELHFQESGLLVVGIPAAETQLRLERALAAAQGGI